MTWIVAIIIGGLIGWAAGTILNTESWKGFSAYILIGIIGSVFGAWLFGSALEIGGTSAAESFNLWALIWGILGAVILIAILRVIRVFR